MGLPVPIEGNQGDQPPLGRGLHCIEQRASRVPKPLGSDHPLEAVLGIEVVSGLPRVVGTMLLLVSHGSSVKPIAG